ncbi:MAG: hypothetical protein ACI4NO_07060 [Oxalobacter sp.]
MKKILTITLLGIAALGCSTASSAGLAGWSQLTGDDNGGLYLQKPLPNAEVLKKLGMNVRAINKEKGTDSAILYKADCEKQTVSMVAGVDINEDGSIGQTHPFPDNQVITEKGTVGTVYGKIMTLICQ